MGLLLQGNLDASLKVRCLIVAQRPEVVDVSIEGAPMQKVPQILLQFSGQSVVVVVDSKTATGHSNMQAWLSAADPAVVAQCPIVAMTEGDALWIPMGAVALVMPKGPVLLNARPPKVDLKECKQTTPLSSAFGVLPCLCSTLAKYSDIALKRSVAATLTQSVLTWPQSFRSSGQSWKVELESS